MISYSPTLEEARAIAASGAYQVIPVKRELYADFCTPIRALRILQEVSTHTFLLESIEDHEQWGRYTFLGYHPTMEITCTDGHMTIKAGSTIRMETDHPGAYLRQVLAEHKSPRLPNMPSFTGGLVGYFSYDYIKYAEPNLDLSCSDDEGFQDVDLMLFDKVICFDNYRQKIILIANVHVNELETDYFRACSDLDQMANLLIQGQPQPAPAGHMVGELKPIFDREAYCSMVEKAKRYIREGDIFQVVLSNRLEAEFEGSLLNVYRVLRTTNPSPYMFYFSSDDIELAGASPETLVKMESGVLHTFPLAGTRPRGKTPEEDAALEESLLEDPKELAEHNMLVDLGRNDLGKISQFGTVQVERYHQVLKYSHVMHIGSTVAGQIRPDKDAVDAVDAVLPAGTLSGAPKFRACQIIHELEGNKRGIYGGAVGYLDFTGNLDTCIAIRLAFRKNGKVYVRSGAGIVADSVPETEYQECINKAMAVVKALELAEGGLQS
ncbi:MAG: anthranilate synthase component I [Oscillospiraceae bacterium]|nr:anthranilate synthase component I [Oscillospiraceae bacterium]